MKKHNDQPIKDVLRQFVDNNSKLRPKLHQTKIKSLWVELMGPTISSYTKEIRLYRNKLFLTITSAPLRQELSYGKEKMKKLFNEALGEEVIEEIVIR